MATITLERLRQLTRELADQETLTPTVAFVEDTPELDSRINERLCDLRDLMISVQGQEWASATVPITLVTGVAAYNLPPDFDELLGVRAEWGAGQYPLTAWNYADLAELESGATASDVRELRYRLRGEGQQIDFRPTPGVAWVVHLDYIPAYQPLVLATDVTFTMPFGAWMHAVYAAAIDCLAKEDLDTTTLAGRLVRKEALLRQKSARRDAGAPVRVKRVRRDDYASLRLPRLWRSS